VHRPCLIDEVKQREAEEGEHLSAPPIMAQPMDWFWLKQVLRLACPAIDRIHAFDDV
jgi:hypothetical protein